MSIYEIIKKLIGSITPYGDSTVDATRIHNLEAYEVLAYALVIDLIEVAKFKNSPEYSMRKMGDSAFAMLEGIKKRIEED